MSKSVHVDVELIASLIKVKNLSESEFAEAIGVSHSTVNRVMNGKRGAGTKFISGVLSAFPDISYGQLIKCDLPLTKGNKDAKRSA